MNLLDIVFGLLALGAFIWVTYDVWTYKQSRFTPLMKVIWTIAALFLSLITAIVYYFVEWRNRNK